jgi:hypothetical protein
LLFDAFFLAAIDTSCWTGRSGESPSHPTSQHPRRSIGGGGLGSQGTTGVLEIFF